MKLCLQGSSWHFRGTEQQIQKGSHGGRFTFPDLAVLVIIQYRLEWFDDVILCFIQSTIECQLCFGASAIIRDWTNLKKQAVCHSHVKLMLNIVPL